MSTGPGTGTSMMTRSRESQDYPTASRPGWPTCLSRTAPTCSTSSRHLDEPAAESDAPLATRKR